MNLLNYVSSHRAAYSSMLLVMAGLLLRLGFPQQAWLSDSPLYLLLLCLSLSLLYHWRRFISQPLMLVFHLGLLFTLGAMLIAPNFRATGYFELAEGQTLHDHLIFFEGGHFADSPPTDWSLTQETIHVEYQYGNIGKAIHTQLFDQQQGQTVAIGFMQAATIHGYRIEPTGNMGYAAVFTFTDLQGKQTRGVVNFPGYPTQKLQTNPFKTPNGKWTNATLEMEQWPYQDHTAWTLAIPASARIKLKAEQNRFVLKPGEIHKLPSGQLKLDKISRWLGYKLSRDPLAPMIFFSSLLSCLSLALYYLRTQKIEIVKWYRVFSTAA